jgi:hypothetical protein
MRTYLLAVGLGLLAAPAVSAQTTFGLRAGLNVTNVSTDDDAADLLDALGLDKRPRLGLVAGVFADVALTPNLTFHPEVLYSQKGFTLVPEDEDIDASITQQIDYVEVPLLLSYRIPAGPNGLVFGLEGGPTLAYKVSTGTSCSGDDISDAECDGFDVAENEDDGVRDYDLGAALGLTVGAGPFGVGARFTQGITTIDDTEGQADEEDDNVRNQAFSVTAQYSF